MKPIKIGLTHGDINGISYELLVKVMQTPELLELCTPIIFGSEKLIHDTATLLELPMPRLHVIDDAQDAQDGAFNLVNVCDTPPQVTYGEQTEAALKAEADSLTAALEAYQNYAIQALVTLPGHLDNDASSHALSDFISRALGADGEKHFDWTLCDGMRSTQLHPRDASTSLGEGLAAEALHDDLLAIHRSLRQDIGLLRPRMALVSNQEHLHVDLKELRDEDGVLVFGPFATAHFMDTPADTADAPWWHHYDATLYVDEPQAQAKAVAETQRHDVATGYVSGLPLVLCYPLQGINYAHAGKGRSDETPLRHAIFCAVDITRQRAIYRRATHHPLEKHWVPRGRDDFKLDLSKEE